MYVDVYLNADGLEEDWSPGKGVSSQSEIFFPAESDIFSPK